MGEEKARELKIVYDGPVNAELEDQLVEVLEGAGYRCWAAGYDHTTHKRDIAFEKTLEPVPG